MMQIDTNTQIKDDLNNKNSIQQMSHKERLILIEKEFNSKDGILDFVVGLVFCLYSFYRIAFFHNIPLSSLSMKLPFLCFIVFALIINSYQNHNVKKKYPDLSKKDLYSMSVSSDQLIMVPGFIGILACMAVLATKGITLPEDFLNILLFMLYAICGVTFLCFIALKYKVFRMWCWFFLGLLITISIAIFNYGWLTWNYLVGSLGIIMIIIGIITHIRFSSMAKKEIG
jgi:hypothetical protein